MDTSIHSPIDNFLSRYCRDPEAIKAALARTSLETILDKHPDEVICSEGDQAEACWLILEGHVDIRSEGAYIWTRGPGELIGEQAFLKALNGLGDATRTATMIARDNVKLLCINAAFHNRLSLDEEATWFLTLAVVVNDKLEQATHQRATLQKAIEGRDKLLGRFADEEPLGIVKLAVDRGSAPVSDREAVVWFSDLARFSTWARGKKPDEVARLAKGLIATQINLIRESGGTIDKLLGDGVMAFWFSDVGPRKGTAHAQALRCAQKVVAEVGAIIRAEGLADELGIRIGMHCGAVAFGDFGASERIAVTILGETVNLAARFEQAKCTDLKSIRVSPEMKDAATKAGAEVTGFAGPFKIRIKEDEIDVFTM